MASLFISYSRRDIGFARKLTESFNGQGLDFWIDWEGIPPTVDWWKEIEKGIEEADIFLFLLSPDSALSKVCRQEIEHAAQNGKRLIPIVVREIKADEAPPELKPLNWIFVRENDDFSLGFSKLITAIKTDYGWVQAHRELQVKALEWKRSNHDHSFMLRGTELQNAELQLATNAAKDPHPTDVQHQYVLKSRQAADRQRRRTTTIVSIVAVIMAALAIFGFVQARLATDRALIARVRELAAQSDALRNRDFPASLLLGIEAFQADNTIQTRGVLMDNAYANPALQAYLVGHEKQVLSVAFSPDGMTLASGSADSTIILWDANIKQPIGEPLRGHSSSVLSVDFSPDGKTLASGSVDNTIILWDMETHQTISQALRGHENIVYSVAFSPGGKLLASGSWDGSILLWDTETKQTVGQPLRGRGDQILCLAFSPDGQMLVSGSSNGMIDIWDVATREHLSGVVNLGLNGAGIAVSSIQVSPDGRTLVWGDLSGAIALWDLQTEQATGSLPATQLATVTSLAFSPDGSLLVSGNRDNSVILWDMETKRPLGEPLTGHTADVTSVALHPDRPILASASDDGTLVLWNMLENPYKTVDSPPPIKQLLENADSVGKSTFTQDRKKLAWTGADGKIIIWDLETGQALGQPLDGHTSEITRLEFSPDGNILASGDEGGVINLWDAKSGSLIRRLQDKKSINIYSITFSWEADGQLLASGTRDGTLTLWEVQTGELLGQHPSAHVSIVDDLAFSPNRETLASTSESTILFWDVQTGELIGRPLTGHNTYVRSLAFSPDGGILASSSWDDSIILWDVETRQPIGQPLVGDSYLIDVYFSLDGNTLVSSRLDGSILLWDVSVPSWIERTCQRVGRNFTRAEWGQYFPNENYRRTCPQWSLESEAAATFSPTP